MTTVNILVVDDEDFVCRNLILKLNRLSHHVSYQAVSCNSVTQALIFTGSQTFDVIFTDIRMPFIDGLSFIKKLRDNGYKGHLLVLSGFDDFDYVRTAFKNGADDYILKPIDINALDRKLKELFPAVSKDSKTLASSENPANVIDYVKDYINKNYSNSNLTMEDAARHISLSYSHFSNIFRKETGSTFPAYLLNIRVQKAIEFLSDPTMKMSDICYKCGFKNPQQFSRDFKKVTGVYPTQYNEATKCPPLL